MNLPSDPAISALERARRVGQSGVEYWLARQIQPLLGYETWEYFEKAIERGQQACAGARVMVEDHFLETTEKVPIGSGAVRERRDVMLSRYACYLIAMNGDPRKPEIAAAQTYFAVQTRRMELEDQKSDDEKRLELREKVTQSHKRVSGVAKNAGVRNHMQGIFHDARFRGLYGKPGADVKRCKGIGERDNLFDRAGPLELSANEFQMNLAASVIEKEGIRNEQGAISRKLSVGNEVRSAMIKSGAQTPENLPLDEPISAVKKRISASRKQLAKKKSSNDC